MKVKNKSSSHKVTADNPIVIELTLEGSDEVLSLLKRLNLSTRSVNDLDSEYGNITHECHQLWAVLSEVAIARGVL